MASIVASVHESVMDAAGRRRQWTEWNHLEAAGNGFD